MRYVPILIYATVLFAGCSLDCLPEPESDETPPIVRAVVEYQPRPNGPTETYEAVSGDSSVTLSADRNSPVKITFAASDSLGMRNLTPGITIQYTVATGVERRSVNVKPVEASCPRPRLERGQEVYGTGEERVVILSAGAENWVGGRSSIEPVTVRMR